MISPETGSSSGGQAYAPITTAKVEQFVHGVRFPCDKYKLIDHARQLGAPWDVLDLMKQFPEGPYTSARDVSRGVSRVIH